MRLACPPPLALRECYAITPFSLENNAVGGKLSLDYRFADSTLGYASVSRGFKAGGVSIAPLDYAARGGSSVVPEYLLTYEFGLKAQAFANRLRVNTAVFDNRWTNEQLFLALNTPGTGLNPVYVNVPRSQSYGADVEIEWAPTSNWLVRSALGLLESSVQEVGAALAASHGAQQGSVLIASPKETWSALIRRSWSVPGGNASVQGESSYTAAQHFDLINSPDQIEPGYWLFNARAAYRFGGKAQYEISAWGKNLTRTQYCVARGSQAGLPFGNTAICGGNEATRFFGLGIRADL